MSAIRYTPDTVTDNTGKSRDVNVTNCHCGSQVFYIFRVSTDEHDHIQCAQCGATFCPAGTAHQQDFS